MSISKFVKKEAQKFALEKAMSKIQPMDSAPKPALGWKARLAAALAIIGTAATLLSQYLAG